MVLTHHICGHLFYFLGCISVTSLNNRLLICEADGCSAALSLLSTVAYLLSLKCRRFTFGRRWTAGYQSSSCSQCDIQTQQIRCLPTAASSHQGSNLSRSASVMIHPPAAVGRAISMVLHFHLLSSFLSITLSDTKCGMYPGCKAGLAACDPRSQYGAPQIITALIRSDSTASKGQ